MNPTLEKALAAVRSLPDDEQERLAHMLLAEIESDARFNTLFEQSQDVLADLADEALAAYQSGKTEPLNPDNTLIYL